MLGLLCISELPKPFADHLITDYRINLWLIICDEIETTNSAVEYLFIYSIIVKVIWRVKPRL